LSDAAFAVRMSLAVDKIFVANEIGRVVKINYNKTGGEKFEEVITWKAHFEDKDSGVVVNGQRIGNVYYQIPFIDIFPRTNVRPNVIVTGGGNNMMKFWNHQSKVPLGGWRTKAPVTAGCFSPCGNYLAYAVGDNWGMGVHGMYEYYEGERIWVHKVCDQDFQC
jgi:hypothetical protein